MSNRDALTNLQEFCQKQQLKCSQKSADGRLNSIDDEEMIIDKMIDHFGAENIKKPPARWWYDVLFFDMPLQIKSSSFKKKGCDNFSSKAAILWAFSDISFEKFEKNHTKFCRSWKTWQKSLQEYKKTDNERDYHILVLNKDTGRLHATTLKSLRVLSPNGNNLPFQVCWEKNKEKQNRTGEKAWEFIMEAYKTSVRKKTSSHEGYEAL